MMRPWHHLALVLSLGLLGASPLMATTVVDLGRNEQDLTVFSRSFLDEFTGTTGMALGDLDGDGDDDLAFGAPSGTGGGTVSILMGPLPRRSVRDFSMDPPDVTILARDGSSQLGRSLAIGDINGDGIGDLALGAPGATPDPSRPGAGEAYVLYGPFIPGIDIDLLFEPPEIIVQGIRGFGGPGSQPDQLGWAVAIADLDGDGRNDLAIGAPGASRPDGSAPATGAAHVLFGPFLPGTVWDLATMPADVTVHGRVVMGGGQLGKALGTGDVMALRGGLTLAIGAPTADDPARGLAEVGNVVLLDSPFSRGDVFDLALGDPDATVFGPDAGDRLGEALATGNLDGGGFRELVMSAPQAGGPGDARPFGGEVHVMRGPVPPGDSRLDDVAGLSAHLIWGADGLDPLDPTGDLLGTSLAVADVTGDGLDDIAMGAPGSDGPLASRDRGGAALMVCGPICVPSCERDLLTAPADLIVYGARQNHQVGTTMAAGDFDGDGRDELMTGSPRIFERLPSGGAAFGVVVPTDVCGARPNLAPVCDAGGPYVIDCNTAPACPLGYEVQLDGSGSVDPEGLALRYDWFIGCGPFGFFASGQSPVVCVSPSCGRPCLARLTVTDAGGLRSECAFVEIQLVDSAPPVLLGVPADSTAECDAVPAPAAVTATDACSGTLPATFAEIQAPGPCPQSYTLTRTWTAADACANVASAQQVLTVLDRTAPQLLGVPADETVDCLAVPPPAGVIAVDLCDPAPGLTFGEVRVDGPCPGTYTLLRTWTTLDACANASATTQVVSVRDTTPPMIQPGSDDLHCLWPPNHRMECFTPDQFSPVITDDCSEPVTWRFAGCASDQPDDGLGDGSTEDDCVVADDGQGFCVRAERHGPEPAGRRYAVAIVATDACGNESEPVVIGLVHVPHDQRPAERCR
jgi:hypothetical protein